VFQSAFFDLTLGDEQFLGSFGLVSILKFRFLGDFRYACAIFRGYDKFLIQSP
jgi:hypothetical protein